MQLYEIHKSCITEEVIWAYEGRKAAPHWFVSHIFFYLRTHANLLENTDYKRLYEECIVYLNKHMNQNKAYLGLEHMDYREYLEQWADIVHDLGDNFEMESSDVENFLNFRRRAWKS